MKYVSLSELMKRIEDSLKDRNLIVERTSGYSEWLEAKTEPNDEFAGAIEKVIRNIIQE